MAKRLLWNLIKTYLISVSLSLIVNFIYYCIYLKNIGGKYDFGHIIQVLLLAVLFISAVMLIMSLPVLFLSYPDIRGKLINRILLYFSGPVVFIVAILSKGWKAGDSEVYLFTGMIYLAVYAVFYRKLLSRQL